jgi:hypothetical protein
MLEWLFGNSIMIEADDKKATLSYKGKTYNITNAEIPDIIMPGKVKVKITKTKNIRKVDVSGSRGLSSIAFGDKTIINDVDIEELIRKLEA